MFATVLLLSYRLIEWICYPVGSHWAQKWVHPHNKSVTYKFNVQVEFNHYHIVHFQIRKRLTSRYFFLTELENKNAISKKISPRYVICTCVQDTNRKTNSHFRLAHLVKNTYAACPSGLHQVQDRRKFWKPRGEVNE